MNREKARGPGYEDLFHRIELVLGGLVHDYRAGKPCSWEVVPKQLLGRVWGDFVRDGFVRDDRALDNILATLRDAVVRLQIANIVAGHEEAGPESLLDEHFSADEYEAFCSWLIDSDDGWRISDYGIVPLQDAIALAIEAKTPAARLKYLDRALHVTHQRGDLSKLFVEGGRSAVQVEALA